MIKTKKLFAVEYRIGRDITTFEIFKTLTEAKEFASKEGQPLYLFIADFDEDLFFEEDESLNYDDRSGLFTNQKIVECYICGCKK